MTHNDDFHGTGDDFVEIQAVDRIVDALGRGENVFEQGHSDPLYELLARARSEADTSIPPAPQLDTSDIDGEAPEETVVPIAGAAAAKNKRRWKRRAQVAAAGGASMTTLLIAGGVAAAIAVGGLGYAAYQHSQPVTEHKITQAGPDSDVTSEQTSPQATNGSGQGANGASGSPNSGKADRQGQGAPAMRDRKDRKESPSPTKSRESEVNPTESRTDAEKLADGLNQALEDPRVTRLPGYTPPPAVAQKMREKDGGEHPAYGEFTEPEIPGLNAPMLGGSPTSTSKKPTDTSTPKSTTQPPAPAPVPVPGQQHPPRGS
ncbi:hypothetical protein [Corynebacterium sp. HMSC28B08]|uniref:hypothetical protein n=1 Tax=Corynebacterium TaxID=1716 RepID=UPI0008A220EB|nr:hypothetical protein [Corynebacterium sp. HMSC28B08]OFT88707.1 hypothetical protein HMPREF3098_07750 [Corynebacterium sp. HMSC28B08]